MFSAAAIPQPIPYQGSKRLLAPEILRYFPERINRLVEPFAGSAAISIAIAVRRCAKSFWLNDAHEPLVELWRAILNRPTQLADEYSTLWQEQLGNEREYFNQIRHRFNQFHQPADFLYLLARCVKAAIRYNSNGEFNNTPDNRRRGARPAEMRRRIEGAAELLKHKVKLTSLDFKDVLAKCIQKDVVYMDPPYQGVCTNRDQRYLPTISHDEFCESLAELNSRRIMYSVSYDGRTGDKVYGEPLPESLNLQHLELCAGRSTQATLLGREDVTYEGFYLSPALVAVVGRMPKSRQLAFL